MPIEIERKFLVDGDFAPYVASTTYIVQGYLSSVPERTVRVRIRDNQGYITIKGISSENGLSRFEWEKEISLEEAKDLLGLCAPHVIEKRRHLIPSGSLFFEVDEFLGVNNGLVIAEIELPFEDTIFEKPGWLGVEVTGDSRYYNSFLNQNPYSKWIER